MEHTSKVIYASRIVAVPVLDGELEKWSIAPPVVFGGRPLRGRPRHATVYSLWNRENLYFAFDVFSSKLQAIVREQDGENLWLDDGVEVLIDAWRHRTKDFLPDDFSYHINILNIVYDDRGTPEGTPNPAWNGRAEHAVTIIDDYHYVVEIAVPWEEIGLAPVESKTVLGVEFCVNGRDPETGKYDYFDWCGLEMFHDPSGFGNLVLVGQQAK